MIITYQVISKEEGRDERGEKRRKEGLRQQTQPATSCNGCYQFCVVVILRFKNTASLLFAFGLELCLILAS